MTERKPTLGAQRRFERLEGMLPATVSLGADEAGERDTVSGTIVDISTGCLCVRVPLSREEAEALKRSGEGDFVETQVQQTDERRWTILGHVAWLWIPTMEGDDTVGSLGIDIAGVIEETDGVLSKLRGLLGDREVKVERQSRRLETPAQRRERLKREEASKAPETSEAPAEDDEDK